MLSKYYERRFFHARWSSDGRSPSAWGDLRQAEILCRKQYPPEDHQHSGSAETGSASAGLSTGAGSDSFVQRYATAERHIYRGQTGYRAKPSACCLQSRCYCAGDLAELSGWVALRQTNYVKSIVTAQGKMDLERKGKQSYQGWMFARLIAFSNGDLQALYDRSDGFYRRQLVLTTKEKPMDRADDPDLAEKMKAEAEGIFLWAFEGLQRLVANNFKFTESDRIRENREAVKRANNNIFDFMDSEGYIQRKADASISSKDFYEIYRMWCEENSLAPLKARSFSDAIIANAGRFNLEHCNNITNSAGRRVWGFMGVEAIARPHINGFYGDSPCTYVPEDIPEEWRQVE